MAELFQRGRSATRAKEELRIALDLAETTEQKKIARICSRARSDANPRRAWRPDFSKLLRRPRPKK